MPLSQPGIFNALDYGLKAESSGGTGPANQGFLQDAIAACQAAGGGTVLIPSQDLDGNTVYPIIGPIDVGLPLSGEAEAIIIAGTAQGQVGGPTLLVEGDGTLFSVDTSMGHIGGVTFRDFGIQYDKNPDTDAIYSGTAIEVINGENVRIERVVFYDCAQAVWFANTYQCTIFECTAQYANITTPVGGACIVVGDDADSLIAKEIYIAGCVFLSNSQGGTGMLIQGSEHVRVMNVRIDGFTEGINIMPGASISGGHNAIKHYYGDVSVYTANPSGPTGPALTIQPQGPQNISEIVFSGCVFEPDASATPGGPGVYIDQGIYGSVVDTIRFVSCKAVRWAGPGIDIVTGSNIEVIGGLYASNASGASPSGGSGGISITGPATGVRILGAACIGSYPYFINHGGPQSVPTQDIGIYIAGSGASNVIIDHCDLTGNSENGVFVGSGELTVSDVFIRNCNVNGYSSYSAAIDIVGTEIYKIQVTDCAGYNDQAVPVATTPPAVDTTFSGPTYGYYGPVTFYAAGATELMVNTAGHSTGLINNSFTLAPGQTCITTLGGGGHNWTTFLMVGQ